MAFITGAGSIPSMSPWTRMDADYPGRGPPGPPELLIRKEEEAEFMKLLDQLPVAHRSRVAPAFR